MRKAAVVIVLLAVFAAAGAFFANRIPTSFLPDEDQGYAYVSVQLPNGASSNAPPQSWNRWKKSSWARQGSVTRPPSLASSLLSFVRTSYNATFFVNFKPWDERKRRDEQFQALKAHLNRELSKLPTAAASVFRHPLFRESVPPVVLLSCWKIVRAAMSSSSPKT